MAKALIFEFGGNEVSLSMKKVDRAKLYGYKDVEVLDEDDGVCELATLAEDGRTVVGKGGTAMSYLDVDGNWCERTEIKPINLEGEEITPVGSSFSAPIELAEKVSIEDYLQHNIRLIYQMDVVETEEETESSSAAFQQLLTELKQGAIFKFKYSYRGGLEPDVGFLLTNHADDIFFLVGNKSTVDFVGLQQAAVVSSEAEDEDDGTDLMDFDMI